MEGHRVDLRSLEAGDAEVVVAWRNDPGIIAQLFSEAPPTRESHLRWFEQVQREGGRQEFIIIERATGQRIGTVGLSGIDPGRRCAEYGILIGEEDARGKGLAHEASELILRYAFEQLNLERVTLNLFADNTAALKCYHRLGFVRQPTLDGERVKGRVRRRTWTMWLSRERWSHTSREEVRT